MINIFRYYIRFADRLNESVGQVVNWLCTVLVLIFCVDVLMRYVFDISFVAVFELEWHIFSIIFLLGAGYTLKHDRHVRVDVIYSRMNDRQKAWVNLLGGVLFLVPLCLLAIFSGIPYMVNSYKLMEGSADPGGLPARYLIKSTIIIGFALLLLQGVRLVFASLLQLLGHSDQDIR